MCSSSTLIRQLVEAGFTVESAAAAVASEDLRLLVHTGRYQVWLSAPDDSEDQP